MFIIGVSILNVAVADEKDLADCENTAEWSGFKKLNQEFKRSGNSSFELYGKYPAEMICKQMIPVDFNKTYKLSVWMRTLEEQLPASAHFGLYMYDKNKKRINIGHVNAFPSTETSLTAAAAKDTKELRIAKNAEWLKFIGPIIAFNIQDNYQDLPNFDVSPRIDKIIDDGGEAHYKVILLTPLKKDYPSGTKIRLHAPWGAPFYWAASGWMPTEWKQFTATLKGEAQCGIPNDKFWKGTKYVRVFVWFGNWDRIPKDGAILLVDDIKFTCEE